jgi:hypothetical protein
VYVYLCVFVRMNVYECVCVCMYSVCMRTVCVSMCVCVCTINSANAIELAIESVH